MSADRVLTCVPDGNPDSYQFGQWRHTTEDGTEIRQLSGRYNTTHSFLTLPDPGVTRRYEDTGYYTCTATNNIPVLSYYSSGSVFFVVEASPVITTNTALIKGQIGNNITIEVEFYSRPAVIDNVTWTKGLNGLPTPDKSVTSVDVRSISLPFYGVETEVEGYVAAIIIHSLVEQDFGNYTVTIENRLGNTSFHIDFKSASPPLPPDNVVQLIHDISSINVQWTPRFNGGAEQHFIIGYKSDIAKDFSDLYPIPDTHEPTQSYQITGLQTAQIYFIRLYAENEIGRSGYVYLNQTTKVYTETPSCVGPVVGGVAGSVLTLTFIAVAGLLFWRIKRRKGSLGHQTTNPESRTVYQDLDLTNIDPSSIYTDLQTSGRNMAGSDSSPNISTYETLGVRSEPNIYDDLSKKPQHTDATYVNTIIQQR
ncbi:nephrin-like [Pecten maximus]|uniref:nephrin-like n=1 Tax=Pecten maximus TaxID=6579 RepID=UPI0014586D9B|nr:nephrin-like [Pecten maximus]